MGTYNLAILRSAMVEATTMTPHTVVPLKLFDRGVIFNRRFKHRHHDKAWFGCTSAGSIDERNIKVCNRKHGQGGAYLNHITHT